MNHELAQTRFIETLSALKSSAAIEWYGEATTQSMLDATIEFRRRTVALQIAGNRPPSEIEWLEAMLIRTFRYAMCKPDRKVSA